MLPLSFVGYIRHRHWFELMDWIVSCSEIFWVKLFWGHQFLPTVKLLSLYLWSLAYTLNHYNYAMTHCYTIQYTYNNTIRLRTRKLSWTSLHFKNHNFNLLWRYLDYPKKFPVLCSMVLPKLIYIRVNITRYQLSHRSIAFIWPNPCGSLCPIQLSTTNDCNILCKRPWM